MKNSFKLALLALCFAGYSQSAGILSRIGSWNPRARATGIALFTTWVADLSDAKGCGPLQPFSGLMRDQGVGPLGERLANDGVGLVTGGFINSLISSAARDKGAILLRRRQWMANLLGSGLAFASATVFRENAKGDSPFIYNPWAKPSKK